MEHSNSEEPSRPSNMFDFVPCKKTKSVPTTSQASCQAIPATCEVGVQTEPQEADSHTADKPLVEVVPQSASVCSMCEANAIANGSSSLPVTGIYADHAYSKNDTKAEVTAGEPMDCVQSPVFGRSLWNSYARKTAVSTISISNSQAESIDVTEACTDSSFRPSDTQESSTTSEDISSQEQCSDRKFICFEACLDTLFMQCITCGTSVAEVRKSVIGSALSVEMICLNSHSNTWRSQQWAKFRKCLDF